jgi:hypothetical protein
VALVESAAAAWTAATASNAVTSASFTPAAGTLLVALVGCGNNNGVAQTGVAVTDSVGGTWTQLIRNFVSHSGDASVWVKDAGPSPSAQTVTATMSPATVLSVGLAVRQFAGALPASKQNGATAGANGTIDTVTITPLTTNSQIVGAFGDASGTAVIANGSTSIYGQGTGTTGEGAFEAIALSTAQVAQTLGYTVAQTSNIVAAEILPATVGPIFSRPSVPVALQLLPSRVMPTIPTQPAVTVIKAPVLTPLTIPGSPPKIIGAIFGASVQGVGAQVVVAGGVGTPLGVFLNEPQVVRAPPQYPLIIPGMKSLVETVPNQASANVNGVAAVVTVAGGIGTPLGIVQNIPVLIKAPPQYPLIIPGMQEQVITNPSYAAVNITGVAAQVIVSGGIGTPLGVFLNEPQVVRAPPQYPLVIPGMTDLVSTVPTQASANVTGVAAAVTVAGGVGVASGGAAADGGAAAGAQVVVAGGIGVPFGFQPSGVLVVSIPPQPALVNPAALSRIIAYVTPASANVNGAGAQVIVSGGIGTALGIVQNTPIVIKAPPQYPLVIPGMADLVGNLPTQAGANVTGVGAQVIVAGGIGAPSGGANVTGVAALVTVSGGIGTALGIVQNIPVLIKAPPQYPLIIPGMLEQVITNPFVSGGSVQGVAAQVIVAGGIGTPLGVFLNEPQVVRAYPQYPLVIPGMASLIGTFPTQAVVNIAGVAAQVIVASGIGVTSGGANVSGVAAVVTVAGGIGSSSSGVSLFGVAAVVTVNTGVGTVSGGAPVIGVSAPVVVAGGIGTPSGGASTAGVAAQVVVAGATGGLPAGGVVGTAAHVTVAGGVGLFSGGASASGFGASASIPVAGGIGTPSGGANVSGIGATVLVQAGIGTLSAAANAYGIAALVSVLGSTGGVPFGGPIPVSVPITNQLVQSARITDQTVDTIVIMDALAEQVNVTQASGSVSIVNQEVGRVMAGDSI